MLSIQTVHGLPRLRAPGIVPCIISFSTQLPWRDHSIQREYILSISQVLVAHLRGTPVDVKLVHSPSNTQHQSYDDCLQVRTENNGNCYLLHCLRQLYTMIC